VRRVARSRSRPRARSARDRGPRRVAWHRSPSPTNLRLRVLIAQQEGPYGRSVRDHRADDRDRNRAGERGATGLDASARHPACAYTESRTKITGKGSRQAESDTTPRCCSQRFAGPATIGSCPCIGSRMNQEPTSSVAAPTRITRVPPCPQLECKPDPSARTRALPTRTRRMAIHAMHLPAAC